MDIRIDISGALAGMAAASEKVHRGIALYGQTAALKMEAYAKQHRPWHDRTASARQTIKGISGWGYISADVSTKRTKMTAHGWRYGIDTVDNPNTVGYGRNFTVGVSGNMPYSPYLEYCHFKYAGDLSILWPAVNALTPETLKGWAAMLNALH